MKIAQVFIFLLASLVSLSSGLSKDFFPSTVTLNIFKPAIDLRVGDYDEDSYLDVFSVFIEDNHAVLRHSGWDSDLQLGFDNGGSQILGSDRIGATLEALVYTLSVNDFNKDGSLDAAALTSNSNSMESRVYLSLGNGKGGFRKPTFDEFPPIIGHSHKHLGTGDFNNDKIPDLVAASNPQFTEGELLLMLGKGDGTFNLPPSLKNIGHPVDMIVDDFNQDQKPDVALADEQARAVKIFYGQGNGTFVPFTIPDNKFFPTQLATADLNRDGKQDLIIGGHDLGSEIRVYYSKGNNGFDTTSFKPINVGRYTVNSITTGDVNLDGRIDLMVAVVNDPNEGSNGEFALFLGNTDQTFTEGGLKQRIPLDVEPFSLAAADFNQDGRLDVAIGQNTPVTTQNQHGGVQLYLGNRSPKLSEPSFNNGTFQVKYADADEETPESIIVNVSGKDYPLQETDPKDTNLEDGKFYATTLPLDKGSYTYQFKASDGTYPALADGNILGITTPASFSLDEAVPNAGSGGCQMNNSKVTSQHTRKSSVFLGVFTIAFFYFFRKKQEFKNKLSFRV